MRSTSYGFIPLVALCLGAVVQADPPSPRDELFRLVPEDSRFCVVIEDLRKRSAEIDRNSLAHQLARLPIFAKSLESADVRKLLRMQEGLLKDLQITPEQLRDDILGDAVVFAFRQSADQPAGGQDEGIFLLWARDKELLKNLIGRINAFQKKSGELKEVREIGYKTRLYSRRVKEKDKGADEFYFIRDNLLAFSSQETLLQAVLQTDLTAPAIDRRLPPWSVRYAPTALDGALATWMVNPRAFDAELHDRSDKADGSQKAFFQEFERYWKATDGLAMSLSVRKHPEINFSLRVRTQDLPKPAQRFFRELGKPSDLWNAMPDNALLAASSRIDLPALTEMFAGFCDAPTRKTIQLAMTSATDKYLGRGNLDTLALGFGPDWGLWMAPPGPNDSSWIPQLGVALKIDESETGKKTEKAVMAALNKLLVFAEFTPGVTVETSKQGEVEVRSIAFEQGFPAGFKPSFAVKRHYLLFASSPSVIARFEAKPAAPDRVTDEAPMLRVSAKSWQDYLQTHRKEAAEFFARTHQTKAELLLPQIDSIADTLKLFDRLEITARSRPDRAILTLRLRSRASP